jgi:uncharacterized damage-inducible protein DinB
MNDNKIEVKVGDYGDYYEGYVKHVEPASCRDILNADTSRMQDLFEALDDEKGNSTYAPGKWSVKGVIQHVMDVERIFCTRALMVCRGEKNPIQGFDHDVYAENMHANTRTIKQMEREWQLLRSSTQALFESFNPSDFEKRGIASNQPITVAALAYLIAGHSLHHLSVLEEKYQIRF